MTSMEQQETLTANGSGRRGRSRDSRLKGPSDKKRSLAALSLASKIGYLTISDLLPTKEAITSALHGQLPIRIYDKGERIFPVEQAEPILFLVRTGAVNVFRKAPSGTRYSVKNLESGAVFGEMPEYGQTMLGAEAEALVLTELAIIRPPEFEAMISRSPTLAVNLVRGLGSRLVEVEKQHEQAAFQTIPARLATLLLRMASSENMVKGISHQDIADELGVYRETVTNAMAELKKAGLVAVGRRRITLLDPQRLVEIDSV
ncbi:MAG: hypothetical protein DMF61_00425 [Blastocatellia bacterium AA13]|nr:MAG: hypothetical protein DMF61_00425 [Blastocatellia bacterium AA13]